MEEYELAVGNTYIPYRLNFGVAGLKPRARCKGMVFVFGCYARSQEFYHTHKHAAAAHVNYHISI